VTAWCCGLLVLVAALLGLPIRSVVEPRPEPPDPPGGGPGDDSGLLLRWRAWWAASAGLGAGCFVSGRWGLVAALVVTGLAWWAIGRTEPAGVRRLREAEARDLPALVHLLAAALETGADVPGALRLVCGALPGAAAEALGRVPSRLELGLDVESAWRPVLDRPGLAPLARTLVRASRSGSAVGHEVDRLARDLHDQARGATEERARTVGVRAAVPLGLCLLPSFVLLGVVPVAAALLRSLAL
jgi:Flp pilus assembly protein TadB